MTAPAKRTARREPFTHAEDLAPAYRELADAIAALVKLEEDGPRRLDARDVKMAHLLSTPAVWQDADAKVAAWQRVGAAARRVHVAVYGRPNALRWDGFKRSAA